MCFRRSCGDLVMRMAVLYSGSVAACLCLFHLVLITDAQLESPTSAAVTTTTPAPAVRTSVLFDLSPTPFTNVTTTPRTRGPSARRGFHRCWHYTVCYQFITHADARWQSLGVGFSPAFVCLSSVGLFFCMISQKRLQLQSSNLTQKCSTVNPGNPFILGSRGQRARSRGTKTVPAWVFALLWVLASCGLCMWFVGSFSDVFLRMHWFGWLCRSVNVPPLITVHPPKEAQFRELESIELPCHAVGIPTPT